MMYITTPKRRHRPKLEELKSEAPIAPEELDEGELYVRPAPKERDAFVTLQSSYCLGVNVTSSRLLGPPENLVLMFFQKRKMFELRPARSDEEGVLAVPKEARSRRGRAKGFLLKTAGYLKRWQLEDLEGCRFAAEIVDGILRVDLNKPMPVDKR